MWAIHQVRCSQIIVSSFFSGCWLKPNIFCLLKFLFGFVEPELFNIYISGGIISLNRQAVDRLWPDDQSSSHDPWIPWYIKNMHLPNFCCLTLTYLGPLKQILYWKNLPSHSDLYEPVKDAVLNLKALIISY